MDMLAAALLLFVILEISNVVVLYFVPGSRAANGVGVFRAYEKSKEDPEVHALVTYLIHWVAGSKVIFIALAVGVVLVGNPEIKVFSVFALILSVLTFFWRLYPAVKAMDAAGQIVPRGYSRTLARIILGLVAVFVGALLVYR